MLMPYVKCSKCHHEWETTDCQSECDWCGAPAGRILEDATSLERMLKDRLCATDGTSTTAVNVTGVWS